MACWFLGVICGGSARSAIAFLWISSSAAKSHCNLTVHVHNSCTVFPTQCTGSWLTSCSVELLLCILFLVDGVVFSAGLSAGWMRGEHRLTHLEWRRALALKDESLGLAVSWDGDGIPPARIDDLWVTCVHAVLIFTPLSFVIWGRRFHFAL